MWLIRPVVRWVSVTSDQVRSWRIALQNVVAGRESRTMLIFMLAEAQGTQRDLQIIATSAFPTPLRENRMLNLRHRRVYRPGENVQPLSEQAGNITANPHFSPGGV
jgi:hypothetical protein